MFFSKNLKYLREMAFGGQNERDLAQDLQINQDVITAYECRKAEPHLSIVQRIARYFGLSIEELVNVDLEYYYHLPVIFYEDYRNVEEIYLE